jgi:hypothetical protein
MSALCQLRTLRETTSAKRLADSSWRRARFTDGDVILFGFLRNDAIQRL